MAKLSLNLSVSWENQDEFKKLLKDVAETQFAYNKALEALNGFEPEMKVVTGYNKEEANHEQTYQKETRARKLFTNSWSAIEFLLDQNNQLWHIVDKMEEINSKNVKATNNRFDTVEADIKALKKTQKKSWFSRN